MSTIEKTFNKTSDKTSAGDSSAGRVAVIKLKAIKISRNGDGASSACPFYRLCCIEHDYRYGGSYSYKG